MRKTVLSILLILISILVLLGIIKSDISSIESFITGSDVTLLSQGIVFLIYLSIFSFLMEKDHHVLAYIGILLALIVSGISIYKDLANVTYSSSSYLTLSKISSVASLILGTVIISSFACLFENKENKLFNIYKIVAVVSSVINTVVTLFTLLFMSNNLSYSSLESLASTAKFILIVQVIQYYSIIGAIITYLLGIESSSRDLTGQNYYADVNNLTYNQNNTTPPVQEKVNTTPTSVNVEPKQYINTPPINPNMNKEVVQQPSIKEVQSVTPTPVQPVVNNSPVQPQTGLVENPMATEPTPPAVIPEVK